MRWLDFLRLRAGAPVVWIRTGERGIIVHRADREAWVRWHSGREEKLIVDEDAFGLALDHSDARLAVPLEELERRRTNEGLRPQGREDGSADELERVRREALAIRSTRQGLVDASPSVVPFGKLKRYGKRAAKEAASGR